MLKTARQQHKQSTDTYRSMTLRSFNTLLNRVSKLDTTATLTVPSLTIWEIHRRKKSPFSPLCITSVSYERQRRGILDEYDLQHFWERISYHKLHLEDAMHRHLHNAEKGSKWGFRLNNSSYMNCWHHYLEFGIVGNYQQPPNFLKFFSLLQYGRTKEHENGKK